MTNQPKCYKCGSTKNPKRLSWMGQKIICEQCSSKAGHKHSMLGKYTYDGTPEWQARHRESVERILANHG